MDIVDTYLANQSLEGLKKLAAQLVVDADLSAIEDREEMIRLLRSNSI